MSRDAWPAFAGRAAWRGCDLTFTLCVCGAPLRRRRRRACPRFELLRPSHRRAPAARANPHGPIDRRSSLASKSTDWRGFGRADGISRGERGREEGGRTRRAAGATCRASRRCSPRSPSSPSSSPCPITIRRRDTTFPLVAAELKATFGPAAVLCTQGDDASSPTPDRQPGGCDAGCPLCQFASHAVLLEAPPPALPERLAIADGPPPTRGDFLRPRASAIRFAQPRAPPLFA